MYLNKLIVLSYNVIRAGSARYIHFHYVSTRWVNHRRPSPCPTRPKKRCWCHQRPRWSTSHPSKGAVLDVCLRMGIETTNQHLKIMNPLSSQPLQLLGWSLTYLIIAALVHLTRFTSNLSWFLICSHRLCGTEKSGHVTWQMWQMGCLSVGSQCMNCMFDIAPSTNRLFERYDMNTGNTAYTAAHSGQWAWVSYQDSLHLLHVATVWATTNATF